jgi:tRNA(Ile)-lysidine synthase
MVEVSKNRSSIESQARQARYKIFESLLDENDQIVLAHHRDDVFETILLRLFRGTGVDGLSGLNEKRSLGKGEIIRPFLNLPKSDLRIFIDENDLPYVEDDTNSKNDFDRNFLRNEIVPSLEKRWSKLPERAALTSLTAKKKKLSLDFMLEKSFKKEISTGIIERAKFIETPSFLIEELIRLILRKKGIALPSQKVLSEIMNVFFYKKPTNDSYVEWSRKDGEQIGGKVFSEHNDIILKKK